MSDQIGKHQPERDRDQARAQHDASEQSDPELATLRKRHRRFGMLAAVALPVIVAVTIVSNSGAGGSRHSPRPPGPQAAATATQRIDALLAGIPERGNALGSPAAPVTLQYFGDLECPTSRTFTLAALPSLIGRWVRGGELRIEYRSLETATRDPEVFTTQQVAALAAGMQDRLWYYVELFYHEQGRENSGYVTASYLDSLAEQTTGLSLEPWSKDRREPPLAAEVATDEQTAARLGLHDTPSFLIGRTGGGRAEKLVRFSVLEPAAFNAAIERLLAGGTRPRSAQSADAQPARRLAVAYRTSSSPAADRNGAPC